MRVHRFFPRRRAVPRASRIRLLAAAGAGAASVLMLTPVNASETADLSLGDAFREGQFHMNYRWRAESVDQSTFEEDAFAIPLRARFNYGTAAWKGFSLFAEFDYVFDFGLEDYNEGGGNTPDRSQYPVIADPAGDDLNQAWLQYEGPQGYRFKLGRQRIIYDNARFIGNVGWRQNEQTYDSMAFEQAGKGAFDARFAWVDKVHRIFGADVAAGEERHDTLLLNGAWRIPGAGTLGGYFYDIDNRDVASQSSQTIGARYAGELETGVQTALTYGLEYAHQQESGDNPVPYSADYWRLDLGVTIETVGLFAGYESLGGDAANPGQAFRTPLATLHAFNGWADQFLTTPDAGLEDLFAGVRGKLLGAWAWDVIYHDFAAASGGTDFGTEWDASIGRKFAEQRLGMQFKTALFDTGTAAFGDTEKFWLEFTADF